MNTKISYFVEYLNERMDYVYDNRIYYIYNKITDETMKVKVNEFYLEVEENEGKTIIYDVLKNYSKNFYMIMV